MKALPVVLLSLLVAAMVAGQNAGEAKSPSAPAPTHPPGELAALEQFLNLSDAELAQMQQIIARLRAMTPEERAKLREEIAAFRQLPEPQRQQLRRGWGAMPPELQAGWREMMQSASAERRAEIQSKMQSLPPDEKMRYRREVVEEYLKAKARK